MSRELELHILYIGDLLQYIYTYINLKNDKYIKF
jgi:hypothetical protein